MVPNGAGWGKEIRLCPPARKGWKGCGKDQQHPSGQMAANPSPKPFLAAGSGASWHPGFS